MKKYKHKITGKVFIETDFYNPEAPNEKYYKLDSVARSFYLEKEFIVSSNDYEEIKEEKLFGVSSMKEESNYLITAFEGNGSSVKFQLQSNGRYKDSDIGAYFDKDFLLKNTTIFSIKNNKGQEFCIGDKVKTAKDKFTISKFEICGDGIIVRFKETLEHDGLKLVSKVKSPIYTTTNGVEIMEGDRVILYIMNKDMSQASRDYVTIGEFSNDDKVVAERYLTFLTKENRDKYIKENSKKPIFVSADGKEYLDESNYDINLFSVYPKDTWTEKRCTVKQAITYENWLHFHTKEARQEYIDNNKPKYSLVDIEKAFTAPHHSPLYIGFKANLKALGK